VKQRTSWLVCVFVPFIVLDLQLAIYCDASGYKVRTYVHAELVERPKKKQCSGHILFDRKVESYVTIRRLDRIGRYLISLECSVEF